MRNFKELWQEYYDDAIEQGFSEAEAGDLAQYLATDYFATQADHIKDRLKEQS